MYRQLDKFVEVLRAAHPYLEIEDRNALAELAILWANRAIEKAGKVTPNPGQSLIDSRQSSPGR